MISKLGCGTSRPTGETQSRTCVRRPQYVWVMNDLHHLPSHEYLPFISYLFVLISEGSDAWSAKNATSRITVTQNKRFKERKWFEKMVCSLVKSWKIPLDLQYHHPEHILASPLKPEWHRGVEGGRLWEMHSSCHLSIPVMFWCSDTLKPLRPHPTPLFFFGNPRLRPHQRASTSCCHGNRIQIWREGRLRARLRARRMTMQQQRVD